MLGLLLLWLLVLPFVLLLLLLLLPFLLCVVLAMRCAAALFCFLFGGILYPRA